MNERGWDPDWEAVSREFGLITETREFGSSEATEEVIVRMIGEQRLRDAVDFFV
jgi:hypothetical protein